MDREAGVVGMLKRWWWVGAVVVALVGAFLLFGRGAAGTPGGAQLPGGSTTTPTASVTPTPTVPTTGTKPPASEPGAPSVTPSKVAPEGSKLTTVTEPPKETLARLTYSEARDGQVYDVEFRPYGTGPRRAGHGTIAVAVTKWEPEIVSSTSLTLPTSNVLLELGPGVSVTGGGAYSGVVKLMKSGDGLVLVLTSVKAE